MTEKHEEAELLFTPSYVAYALDVTTAEVKQWRQDGKIKVVMLGPKRWRIPESEVDRLFDRLMGLEERVNTSSWTWADLAADMRRRYHDG